MRTTETKHMSLISRARIVHLLTSSKIRAAFNSTLEVYEYSCTWCIDWDKDFGGRRKGEGLTIIC